MGLRRSISIAAVSIVLLACSARSSPTFFGEVLTDWDHVWKYEPANTNLAPHPWTPADYDDSSWISGLGVFAFPTIEPVPPERTIRTEIARTNGQITVYFRAVFEWSGPQDVYLTFSNLIDDGAVFYLNGVELGRVRMPNGDVDNLTLATTSREVIQGYDTFIVENPPLVQGWNILAVEVHQSTSTSGDVVFGCYARADQSRPPCGWAPPEHNYLTVWACGSRDLSVSVDGYPRPRVQWYKNGAEIPDATNTTYSLTNISPIDQGNYICKELMPLGSCDLAIFTITVIADVFPFYVQQAIGLLDPTQVRIIFTQLADKGMAEDPFTYDIPGLNIYSAERSSSGREVMLTTDSRVAGQFYDLEVIDLLSMESCLGQQSIQHAKTRLDLETVILPFDSVWKYNNSGVDLGTVWREPEYDDSAWPLGPALLGFETTQATLDALEAEGLTVGTTLPIFTPSGDHIPIYYFRTMFDVRFTPSYGPFTLRHVVDDGAIFYLNGNEVARFNIPPSTMSEGIIQSQQIFGVTAGTSILAVEVHQSSSASNDILFGAQLIGIVPGSQAPRLEISRQTQTGDLTLSWAGRAILEHTAGFPASWVPASNQSNPQTISANQAAAFYRLRR